jgi:hypothetical protein
MEERPLHISRAGARVIALLQKNPNLTKQEISDRAAVSTSFLGSADGLKKWRDLKLIHISAWRQNLSGAYTTPVYSAGPGPDAPKPRVTPENKWCPTMDLVVQTLERSGPLRMRQIAVVSHMNYSTLKNGGILQALLAQKKIHISGWHSEKGGPVPVFSAGRGPGVTPPPPERQSRAKIVARWRAKHRSSGQARSAVFRDIVAQLVGAKTQP